MNRYPLKGKPRRWNAKLSPTIFRLVKPFRLRKQRMEQRLISVEVRNARIIRDLFRQKNGILITPNHPGHADAYCMNAAANEIGNPFYYMTAWQVFAANHPIGRWMLQKHGCFSVDREGADREAFRTAVEILREKIYPLVIFPEGEVYHLNDRVTPFREGAAAIAITASKKSDRTIVCVPCAIKYQYINDPMSALLQLMDQLEERILWRPARDLDLRKRIYRLADGLIAMKEIEYLGRVQQGESLTNRIHALADHILKTLEARYELKSPAERHGDDFHRTFPERVKAVRAAALAGLQTICDDAAPFAEAPSIQEEEITRDLDDVFLVVQLFSYPGDYLHEDAPVERLAETLDKFEEDMLGRSTATPRADRKAVVQFGEPITINAANEDLKKWSAGELTQALESAVQELLDGARGSFAASEPAAPHPRHH